jgi:hypothetical protein
LRSGVPCPGAASQERAVSIPIVVYKETTIIAHRVKNRVLSQGASFIEKPFSLGDYSS